jgi:hypothetical protein
VGDTITLSIPLPSDDDGYLDRQCQFPDCEQYFKVMEADWDDRQPDILHCPVCGYQDEATSFTTHEQDEYAEEMALAYLQGEIKNAFEGVAKKSNRQASRNQLLSIKMTADFPELNVPLSPEVAQSLTMRITCEQCSCRFAVQRPGAFCPLCGKNLSLHTFRQAVGLAQNAVSVVQDALSGIEDPQLGAAARTKTTENQIGNLVTAFQHLAEALYNRLPNKTSLRRNAFQNLGEASTAWDNATGTPLTTRLNQTEWQTLSKYFQQRHVLEHQSGIVDEKYIRDSGDNTYTVGRRLVIRPTHVVQMAELVEKLGLALLSDVPDTEQMTEAEGSSSDATLFPPQLPGTTAADWAVYRAVCEVAVEQDDKTLAGQFVWKAVTEENISEEDFADALDMLESKGIVSQYRTIDSSPIPRQLSLAPRGHELYFKHTRPDYQGERKRIGRALLDGITTSDAICEHTGLSHLMVLHTLNDFVAQRYIPKLTWSAGMAYAFVINDVYLKRFVGE